MGLRDGSGWGNFFGPHTHGFGSNMRSCRQLAEEVSNLRAPNANRKIDLMTVVRSGSQAFRNPRQLHILGDQELAFADSCVLMIGGGDPDHGLWLAA